MDFFDDDFGFPSNQFVKLQEHPSKYTIFPIIENHNLINQSDK
jgi:hypothetical protein